jgi:drug/metabolite transporter (DMT)-like permease
VVLFFTYPAMTVIINALLGERLPLRGWIALGLTTLGVILTVANPNPDADISFSWMGVLIALFNALFVALFIIVNERVQRGYPTTARASAWTLTGTLFVFIPMAFMRGGVALPPDTRALGLLIGLGAFATVLPYFGLILGNKMLGASRAAIVSTLEPVVAVALAVLLLGERLLLLQVVGAVLIVASIIVLEARPPRRKFTTKQQPSVTPN